MARQVDNTACPSPGRDQGAGGARDRGGQDLLQSHGLAGVRGRQGVDDEHLVAHCHQLADD